MSGNPYYCPRCGTVCILVSGTKDGPPGWECPACGALWPTGLAVFRYEPPQMCTANDLIGGEACRRVARWIWQPSSTDHPVFLCNFHADPLITPQAVTVPP